MRLPLHLLPVIVLLAAAPAPAAAQMSASDLVMRLDAIENQMRQLTGQLEQLQFRNQQLEQQLRRTTEDYEFRFQELSGKGGAPRAAQPRQQQVQQPQPQQPGPSIPGRRSDIDTQPDPRLTQRVDPNVVTPNPGGRRGDAFDPNASPNAPGAPRALGALPPGQPSAPPSDDNASIGARGGREPGAPLDLSTMSGDPSQRRGGGAMASVSPPSDSPRDHFDLGYGFIQRKDYASAEQSFREFLQRYPNDRLAPDVNYWLAESLFQRQRYQDAAEAYLVITTKYDTAGKAPDALMRLGQSLAAIGQKEMACASFAEVGRKYPRAHPAVKQGVEREQKRVRC